MVEGIYCGGHACSDGQEQAQYGSTIDYTARTSGAWRAKGRPTQLPDGLDLHGMDAWNVVAAAAAPTRRAWILVTIISAGQVIASIELVHGVWWATYNLYPQVRSSHPSSQSMACGGPLTFYIHWMSIGQQTGPERALVHLQAIYSGQLDRTDLATTTTGSHATYLCCMPLAGYVVQLTHSPATMSPSRGSIAQVVGRRESGGTGCHLRAVEADSTWAAAGA
jgi:hypothetical protein